MAPRSLVIGLLALPVLAACAPAKAPLPEPHPPAHQAPSTTPGEAPRWGLVVHGGAGNLTPEMLAPERQAAHRAALEAALRAGHRVLAQGGSSLDAVVATITILEDSPLFNAGKGAVFTHDGKNELDAALMDGVTLKAGAVAGLRHVKNPIVLARRVMDRSPHVMLIGEGAEEFAKAEGVTLVDPGYFHTEHRFQQLQRALEKEKGPSSGLTPDETKFGTVGAVALDQQGHLAAGTSTGGMTNKRFGRVGDSPIIGAGTYASPGCAVSATGHGEFFIRYTVAHDICARVRYQGAPLAAAAGAVVMDELARAGGEGGVIAMDEHGQVAMVFNTKNMYRGTIRSDGVPAVEAFSRR